MTTRIQMNGRGQRGISAADVLRASGMVPADATDLEAILAVIAPAPTNQPNGFARAKQKLLAGGSVKALVIGDSISASTSGAPTRWVVNELAPTTPEATFRRQEWNDGSSAYGSVTTIQTGSGSGVFDLINASVSGATPSHLMGAKFADAIGSLTDLDVIIWAHGKNVLSGSRMRADFLAAMEQVRLAHPAVPVIFVLESPNRDDDDMDAKYAELRAIAAEYGDVTLLDLGSAYKALGKPASYYLDNIHPGTPGRDLEAEVYQNKWLAAGTTGPDVVAPFLTRPATNLLTNGDFSDWSGSAPAGWTLEGGATATKDTVNKYSGAAYSMKLTGTSALAGISQTITGDALDACIEAGAATLVLRERIETGQANTVGRATLSHNDGASTEAVTLDVNIPQGGWLYTMILLPFGDDDADASSMNVTLYCDTSANASSEARYDRAFLVAGEWPRFDV